MKLALLILFLTTCFGILVWLLIPSKKPKKAKRKTLKGKSQAKNNPSQKNLSKAPTEKEGANEKIVMKEMRDAVQRFAIQNPDATAQVLQAWIKQKK